LTRNFWFYSSNITKNCTFLSKNAFSQYLSQRYSTRGSIYSLLIPLENKNEREVEIGGVKGPVFDSSNPSLVPNTSYHWIRLNNSKIIPNLNDFQETLGHLRWMLQKDKIGQDMLLLGTPGATRRRLAMLFCEITNREFEFLSLSRDTTESDIKQRREVNGGNSSWVDQSAVRAATEGRILILEGLEKAERNILPLLNSLLENR